MQEVLDEGHYDEPAEGWVESKPLTTDDLTEYLLHQAVATYASDYPDDPTHYQGHQLEMNHIVDPVLVRERRFGILQGLAWARGVTTVELKQLVEICRQNDRSVGDLVDSRS